MSAHPRAGPYARRYACGVVSIHPIGWSVLSSVVRARFSQDIDTEVGGRQSAEPPPPLTCSSCRELLLT